MDRVACLGYVASVMGMLAMVPASQAAVFFPDFTSAEYGGATTIFNLSYGVHLTVGTSAISVTQLGFQDMGADNVISNHDGLAASHQVGIWDQAGTLLGSVTVQQGTASTLVGNWRYEALGTPIQLAAGQAFYIGADVGNDPWSWVFNAGDHPTDSAIGGFYGGPGLVHNIAYPATDAGGDGVETDAGFTFPGGQGRPLQMSANAIFAVPEPASLALLSLAGLALMRRRRA